MNAIRNSYFLSRVAVCMHAGSNPSVTITRSMFRVDELAYRTSPARHKLVSRHISRIDDAETVPLDRPMFDRIRYAMSRLMDAMRTDTDEYIQQWGPASNWSFHPRQDGWLATFNGKPSDVNAFHHWLRKIVT